MEVKGRVRMEKMEVCVCGGGMQGDAGSDSDVPALH